MPREDIYKNYFGVQYFFHVNIGKMHENKNTKKYLDVVKGYALENKSRL